MEAYKIPAKKILTSITHIVNEIKDGAERPEDWVEGVISHIYKIKGR